MWFNEKNNDKPESKTEKENNSHDTLNDVSYIKDVKHLQSGDWHQYDILLAARPYNWDYMVDTAEYISHADLEDISTLTVSLLISSNEHEIIEEYYACGNSVKRIPQLHKEQGSLAIGGISQKLQEPLKIVWFNQTNIIRIFGITDDEMFIRKYAETLVRRTFGTPEEMKLGKPWSISESLCKL